MGDPVDADGSLVGVFIVELPPDWWLPEGYSLQPSGGPQVPLSVTDPLGQNRSIYPIAGYRPSQPRVDSIANVIERELGPLQAGFSPQTRHQLGMDRPDLLGATNRTIMLPVEAVVALFDLANYGIMATIAAGTQGMAQAGWMSETDAGKLRRDLYLLTLVAAVETGRNPRSLVRRSEEASLRVATMARMQAMAAAPVVFVRILKESRRAFGIVCEMMADETGSIIIPGSLGSGLPSWLREGRAFNRERARFYEFNEIYVVDKTGWSWTGYWILDSYQLSASDYGLAAGAVSRKRTQLWQVKVESAVSDIREASLKYRPGTRFADVPSTPEPLRGKTITGQLFLEVPVQDSEIPAEILAAARQYKVQIRDVTGKIY